MPAVSKKQYRFMAMVEHGAIKKPGLSPEKAAEFVDSANYKSLPTQSSQSGYFSHAGKSHVEGKRIHK